MKRRQFIRYTQAGVFATLGMGISAGWQGYHAQSSNALTVKALGHTCFLFTGGGRRILVNPFRSIGCTAGYRSPKVNADLVLISSQLLDEGAIETVPGNPRLLYEPGAYQFQGMQVQGITIDKDRLGGKRFGTNVAWKWNQAGINILHLGGVASAISLEQKILMGTPDILFLPVGGGPKAYTPTEAKQALQVLNPKLVVPMHYRTQAADATTCDIVPLDEFLTVMDGTKVNRSGDSIALTPGNLPTGGPVIQVLSYKF